MIWKKYTRIVGLGLLLLAGCTEDAMEKDFHGESSGASTVISASCVIDSPLEGKELPFTRSLMDISTTRALEAQFLRINEDIDKEYTYTGGESVPNTVSINWSKAYLANGNIVSSANDVTYEGGSYSIRDVVFTPSLAYNLRIDNSKTPPDTTHFYHTRMIGWYPRTYKGTIRSDTAMQLDGTDSEGASSIYRKDSDGRTWLKFTGLSAEDDLMVSDVREAQCWHINNRNETNYAFPYGFSNVSHNYLNCFTFHHYRSAVRVYAVAEQSKENLEMWGSLSGVSVLNQPTSCEIRLPDEKDAYPSSGDADVKWSDYKDQKLITTPMFGDDPEHADLNETVDYDAIDFTGSSVKAYLGYAMVEPGKPVTFSLQTKAGVYQVTVPVEYSYTEDGETKTAQIFRASKYYTVNLVLHTSDIAAILETEGDDHYYDLASLSTLEDGSFGYRYSNCYIVDPSSKEVQSALEELNASLPDGQKVERYDGYAFPASIIGNGSAGIISDNFYPSSERITPVKAKLVWESSKGLLDNVELAHSYVRFKLADDSTKGNAVIAVYGSDKNILWSWHIWITDTPSDVTVGGHTFLDRNLGATEAPKTFETSGLNGDSALSTYGLYYQWGRKDPSPGPPSFNYALSCLITAPYYDFSLEEHNAAEVKLIDSPTLKDGVENPMYLILPRASQSSSTYAFNWLSTNDSDLWGYITTGGADQKIQKTIYDPCPYGYRVPANELSSVVSSGQSNVGTYGLWFGNLFLPFAGYKGDDRGSNTVTCAWGVYGANSDLSVMGSLGDYQSSVISTSGELSGQSINENGHPVSFMYHRGRTFIGNQQGWSFYIGDHQRDYSGSYVFNDFTNRRTAAPVRCVKE